jgi:hypothetical protein
MFSVQANEVVETEAESEPTQEQTANETLEAELDMLYNTNQIGSCTPYPECKDN